MRRVFCLLLALSLFCASTALADFDLSGLSFDELLALRAQVEQAIMQSDEWQEVTVPAGLYLVGREIPAGRWVIAAAPGSTAKVYKGSKLNADKTTFDFPYTFERLYNKTNRYYTPGDNESVTWDLDDGIYILVEEGSVVFMPYTGISLGFK